MSAPISRRVELATGLGYHLLEWDGAGSDHSVVLVHGFLDSAWGWEPVAERLAERFHVLAPDMRGHGDSDRVGAGGYYYFMDYVADLASVVQESCRSTLSLVGHSMGGSIASYYAGAYPERVHRLALLEGLGPPQDDRPLPARLRGWIESWAHVRQRPAGVHPSVADAALRLRKHDELLTEAEAMRLAERTTRAVAGGVAFKHDPLHLTRGPLPFRLEIAEPLWRAITCPVLAVTADRSNLVLDREDEQRRLAAFADIRSLTLSGAGHMMQRHQPEALAERLGAFLAGH